MVTEILLRLFNGGAKKLQGVKYQLKTISIATIQADIIFKALHYTARNERLDIPNDLTEIFEVVAEQNPNDTHVTDTLDVMEYLSDIIRNNEPYKEYFEEESEED